MFSHSTYSLKNNNQIDLLHLRQPIASCNDVISVYIGKYATKVFGAFRVIQSFKSKELEYDFSPFVFNVYTDKYEVEIFNARRKLNDSFQKSLKRIGEKTEFNDCFKKMARTIQFLHFEDCFVDVSQTRRLLEFNLSFKNDFCVSIAKKIDFQNSDDVMFAISHEKQNIVIDQMSLKDLMIKIEKSQEIVNKEK